MNPSPRTLSPQVAECLPRPVEPSPEPGRVLAFELELHGTSALVTVLTTLSRLRVEVRHLLVEGGRARVELRVPAHLAHRVAPLLGTTIGVTSVCECLPREVCEVRTILHRVCGGASGRPPSRP
jgi:hypothetical protein